MGLELTGRAALTPAKGSTAFAKQEGDAKILLETDELILRGGVKAKIARGSIRDISHTAGVVTVKTEACTLRLTLGDAAAKFATKLAEAPKSRLEKMGIAKGTKLCVVHLGDAEFAHELKVAGAVASAKLAANAALVVLGVERAADLARIATAAKSLAPNGALWVIHPKGVDGVKDTDIFAVAKTLGLTYTKVARYSATHTAEKLVIPAAARSGR